MTSRDSRKYILAGNFSLLDQLFDQRDGYLARWQEEREANSELRRQVYFWKGACDDAHNLGAERLAAAHAVIRDLLKLVDTELTPNVRHLALQNYQLLNEAPMNARRLLEDQS